MVCVLLFSFNRLTGFITQLYGFVIQFNFFRFIISSLILFSLSFSALADTYCKWPNFLPSPVSHKNFYDCIAVPCTEVGSINPKIETEGDLEIGDSDKDPYWFSVSGYIINQDTAFSGSTYDKQGDFPNGYLNSSYLMLEGGLGKDWSYDTQFYFPSIHSIFITWAYLRYSGFKNCEIDIGQIFIPNGLENTADVVDLLFISPSLLTGTFFPIVDSGLGIMLKKTFLDQYSLTLAVYQPPKFSDNFGDLGRGDRLGEAFRFFYSPVHTDTRVYHFGGWARHQSLNYAIAGVPIPPEDAFEGFFDTPEADARDTGTLVNTGPLQARCFNLSGVEAAILEGPLLIMTEYLHADVYRKFSLTNTPNFKAHVKFPAFYIQAGYVLTGESHVYHFDTSGTFTHPKPKGCWGAFEIAARYSRVTLLDRDVLGGKEHNVTLGINWYVNDKLMISGNYIHASALPTSITEPGTALFPRRRLNIYALMFQLTF